MPKIGQENTEWHSLPEKKVLEELRSAPEGLSSWEAEARLAEHGRNAIESSRKVSVLRLLAEQFASPLVLLLIFAAGFSFVLGKGIDGALILAIVIANGFFGFIQDYKAEKSIEALKKLGAPKALVLRNGSYGEVESSSLVPGDVIILGEGDKVPADARLLESNDLRVDESVLTGESNGVSKGVCVVVAKASIAERRNMVFMHTLIVRGSGKAVVVETGGGTEVGKIAGELESIVDSPTRFHTEVAGLSRKITVVVVALVLLIGLTMVGLRHATLLEAFLVSVSVAVAAIPEGLPAVVTLSLAIATRKMLSRKSLVRKLPVIENLGSVDVICTDKTGTLTENSMTVMEIFFSGKRYEVTGTGLATSGRFISQGKKVEGSELRELLFCGLVCNNTVHSAAPGQGLRGDPTEVALVISATKAGISGADARRIKEIPFSSERRRMTVIAGGRGGVAAYSKGAPEVIIGSCTHVLIGGKKKPLTKQDKESYMKAADSMSSRALRVLAFSFKEAPNGGEDFENGMILLGLQGMIDPSREGVKGALATAKEAGIRVIMLTGDSKLTAKSIASQLGFEGEALEGKDLEGIHQKEFDRIVLACDIFTRMSPEQKLSVLRSLRRQGHSVAMTGDGVNDAPALKEAEVGIAMGIRGNDVAKEASDIVLLDDNFATIVQAIRHGRGVFDNIQKFVNYLLSNNLAEVMIVFIASLTGYLAIAPAQLLWINLLTDGLPAIALGADEPGKNVMKQAPRKRDEQLVNRRLGLLMLSISGILTIIVLSIFYNYLSRGLIVAQTMVFTALVLYEFLRIVMIRRHEGESFFSNKWLVLALLVSFAMQLVVLYTPLSGVFGAVGLGLSDWIVIIIGGAAGYVLSVLATDFIMRKTGKAAGTP